VRAVAEANIRLSIDKAPSLPRPPVPSRADSQAEKPKGRG
jgi:hypothetical protein